MGEEGDNTNRLGVFESLGKFISNLGIKVKLFFVAIFSFFGMILFFRIRNQNNINEMLKYELEKVRSEIEIERAKEAVSINDGKILKLEEKEAAIRKKIEEIENAESIEDVSLEELDKFFDDRGF